MKNKAIANGWDEVSIDLWEEIQDILRDEETDAIDKNVKLVGLLYDIPDEDAYDKPLQEFSEMLDGIGWLGKEPKVPAPAPAYLINGTKYIVNLNPQKILTAQYIDYQSADKDMNHNLPGILACIMVPEGHTYNDGGYDMEKVKKDIRDCFRVVHALSITRFFFQQYITLTQRSLQSLTRILRKEMKKEKNPEKKSKIQEQIEKTQELARMFGSLA